MNVNASHICWESGANTPIDSFSPPHAEIWMDNPAGEGKDQVTKQFWDPDFILLNLNGQLGAVRVSYGK